MAFRVLYHFNRWNNIARGSTIVRKTAWRIQTETDSAHHTGIFKKRGTFEKPSTVLPPRTKPFPAIVFINIPFNEH